MNRLTHGLVLATLLTLACVPAHADVINFDDLTDTTGAGTPIPAGYKGFTWTNFSAVNGTLYPPFSGYKNGILSSPMVAFNNQGTGATINSATDFTFVGANFAAAWQSGLQLQILGFDNGALKYNNTITLQTSTPTWVAANAVGIDSLVFLATLGTPSNPASGTQFAMDNFTYSRGDGTTVVASIPEPAPLPLPPLGAGGPAAYGLVRRRRRTGSQPVSRSE